MPLSWELRECDVELFERELDAFVPDAVFDAHAHLYRKSDWPEPRGAVELGPDVASVDRYREMAAWIVPRRRVEGLFLGFGAADKAAEVNRFVADQAADAPGCAGAMLVTPDMAPDYVREQVRRHGFAALKPYHRFAQRQPTWDADIEEFLPEPQAQVAHEEGLCAVLHLVKPRAVADPGNQATIRRWCAQYPDLTLILAHAARGFNPHHTIEALAKLRDLPNLYCDTSAITDCGALEAAIEMLGPERLLYGSDFPVSHFRGRCVAIGDSFVWLYEDTLDWESVAPYGKLEPVLIGLEALRCLKLAARHARLSDGQIEGVFGGNARRLLGL
jgi:glutamate-1-semialdehyde 2,1-aminomutase